jgi:hypothetical protein
MSDYMWRRKFVLAGRALGLIMRECTGDPYSHVKNIVNRFTDALADERPSGIRHFDSIYVQYASPYDSGFMPREKVNIGLALNMNASYSVMQGRLPQHPAIVTHQDLLEDSHYAKWLVYKMRGQDFFDVREWHVDLCLEEPDEDVIHKWRLAEDKAIAYAVAQSEQTALSVGE